MSEKLYLYPKGIRLWHLANAILIIILIVTGLSIQYVGKNAAVVPFKSAVGIHNIAGVLLSISYFFFFLAGWISKNFRFYHFKRRSLMKQVMVQARFYAFGVFKGEPHPYEVTAEEKFNPLQKVSYLVIMFAFMPIVIFTGWGLLYPELTFPEIFGVASVHVADIVHIISGFIISVFLIIHIYFCTMGARWNTNFKSIVTGYHHHE